MSVTKQLMGLIDFNSIFSKIWKSVGPITCLVTDILQNTFFCVQQQKKKKEIHTGLEQLEGE